MIFSSVFSKFNTFPLDYLENFHGAGWNWVRPIQNPATSEILRVTVLEILWNNLCGCPLLAVNIHS